MRDPAFEIQSEYYRLLNGQVTYAGKVVPVYDVVPKNPSYPYIQIIDKTDTGAPTKSSFGNEITQGISIVSRFDASFGSRVPIYLISDQVQQIILARPVAFNIDEFDVITATLDNSLTRRELTQTFLYLIYELRFRHIVQQLVPTFDQTFDPTFL